jgi:hypothetical protein
MLGGELHVFRSAMHGFEDFRHVGVPVLCWLRWCVAFVRRSVVCLDTIAVHIHQRFGCLLCLGNGLVSVALANASLMTVQRGGSRAPPKLIPDHERTVCGLTNEDPAVPRGASAAINVP